MADIDIWLILPHNKTRRKSRKSAFDRIGKAGGEENENYYWLGPGAEIDGS